MTSYLKWIVSDKTETPKKEISLDNNKTDNIDKTYKINKTDNTDETYSIPESDSDSEYHKIDNKKQTSSEMGIPIPKGDDLLLYANAKDKYDKTYKELVDKEKLVIKRVGSDTFEKIKENYTEYINDDVQIIKEFALVMETFDNIKTRLKNFESDIGNFESGIRKYIVNQDENKVEIDNKINQIDSKLDNTVGMIEKMKSDSDDFIKKIINLENLIKIHDEHRSEILFRLEKFNKEHDEMKTNNLQVLNIFKDVQQYFMFSNTNYGSNYLKYVGISLGICSCLILSYNFVKKN